MLKYNYYLFINNLKCIIRVPKEVKTSTTKQRVIKTKRKLEGKLNIGDNKYITNYIKTIKREKVPFI